MHSRARRLLTLACATVLLLLAPALTAAPASATTSRFGDSLRIDNRLFSLRPGTQFVYDGTITDADGVHPHRIVFTVTDMAKKIQGVWARAIWDVDIIDGEVSEAELAFFAQDRSGNVLTMGEYPEEFENGKFAGAPNTWISGQAGARAGILVPGHPRVGMSFVQGYAPAIDFYDVGVVKGLTVRTCAPVGCFRTVLIRESAPDAPGDGFQTKYYAPGVGLVRIGAQGGDSLEQMTLTRVNTVSAKGMKKARKAVLKLEKRAYRVSSVYRATSPMVRCPGATCSGCVRARG